jgi:uncharacterized membrane protein YkoI
MSSSMTLWLQERVRWLVLATAVLVGAGDMPAAARDQDEARQAVEAGDIRPLREILKMVGGKLPGEIVRVKIERRGGRWMYEFRVVGSNGRLFETYVDARSGEIEHVKER